MLGRATRSVQLFSQGSLHPPATFPHCRSGQCTGLRGFHRSRSVMSAHIYSYTHRASDASSSSSHPVQPTPSGSDKTPSTVQVASHNQYKTPRLLPEHLNPDPLVQFKEWFTAALDPSDGQPQVKEPEAMTVGTVSKEGIPSSRVVLLKTVDERGFVFFTNYNSRKSSELAGQAFASLNFYWREISRQVRVIGRVEKVTRDESTAYFSSRPRGSQMGAWASEQSSEVAEGELERRVSELEEKFSSGSGGENVGSGEKENQVPCPEHWGGWRIVPFEIEFWAGQPSRLHDRFRYTRPKEGESKEWKITRLAP